MGKMMERVALPGLPLAIFLPDPETAVDGRIVEFVRGRLEEIGEELLADTV